MSSPIKFYTKTELCRLYDIKYDNLGKMIKKYDLDFIFVANSYLFLEEVKIRLNEITGKTIPIDNKNLGVTLGKLYSNKEIAAFFNLDKDHFHKFIKKHKIPVIIWDEKILFTEESVQCIKKILEINPIRHVVKRDKTNANPIRVYKARENTNISR